MSRPLTLFFVSLAPLTAPLGAQQLTEGHTAVVHALPSGAGNHLETAFGTVYFDGSDLMLDTGTSGQSLLTFPSFTFGSFTAPIGANQVLFGESSNGGVWSVPLNGGTAQLVANVPFNYDAVLLDDDRALVSAKTGGFSAPDNDVMFVDLLTGQTQLLAQFPGASGPLAVDAAGDVYYATSPAVFPAPPGTVEVLRLSRAVVDAAILSGQVLGAADATVVVQGIDAAGDLAFDDDGDLFFVDWYQGRIGEIHDADGPQPSLGAPLLDFAGSGLYGSALQFVPAGSTSGAVLEPFQPAGGALLVQETDYAAISQVREVTAAQPSLTASSPNPVPAGALTLTVSGGPASGLGVLLFEAAQAAGAGALVVPGFEQPLLLDTALSGAPVVVPLGFDATGAAALTVVSPGFAQTIDATAQVAFVSTADVLGASTPLALQLGP